MSSRRSRSGGKLDLDRVQPEQQVLAEAPRRRAARPTRWSRRPRARRSPPAGWRRPGPPRAAPARSAAWAGDAAAGCRSRRGTGCCRSAAFSRPMRSPAAPVKAPLMWPNSSDSNRLSRSRRDRPQTTAGAAARLAVDFPGDDFLAGAVLARMRTLASVGAAPRSGCDPLHRGATRRAAASRCSGASSRRSAALDARFHLAPAQARPRCAPSPPAARCSTAWRRSRWRRDLIASTAVSTAPCAVMITTAASGSGSMIARRSAPRARRRAAHEVEVEQDRIERFPTSAAASGRLARTKASMRSNMSRSARRAARAMSGSSSTTTARLKLGFHATSVASVSGSRQSSGKYWKPLLARPAIRYRSR